MGWEEMGLDRGRDKMCVTCWSRLCYYGMGRGVEEGMERVLARNEVVIVLFNSFFRRWASVGYGHTWYLARTLARMYQASCMIQAIISSPCGT